MRKKMMEFPAAVQLGREAYRAGIRELADAKKANPFSGFTDDLAEHSKYVCWNRGWNAMKQWYASEISKIAS